MGVAVEVHAGVGGVPFLLGDAAVLVGVPGFEDGGVAAAGGRDVEAFVVVLHFYLTELLHFEVSKTQI